MCLLRRQRFLVVSTRGVQGTVATTGREDGKTEGLLTDGFGPEAGDYGQSENVERKPGKSRCGQQVHQDIEDQSILE